MSRLVLPLFLVCVLSTLAVALVQRKTRLPIERAEEKTLADAVAAVLPPGSPGPEARECGGPEDPDRFTYYVAGGATAFEVTSRKGYGGPLTLLVGFDADGKVYRFHVKSHSETPGLGANLAKPGNPVDVSVRGLPADSVWRVEKDGGPVHALTAATISSRAACDAIDIAAKRLQRVQAEK